jgi:hypothetical protein
MPIATPIGDGRSDKIELKTCPGGYVILKRLDHGQKMFRRGLLAKAKMEAGGGGSREERRNRSKGTFTAEIELSNERVTCYEFANCIAEHNLTYLVNPQDPTSETALDFRIPDHVKMLDGNIGEELDDLIQDFNNWEEDDEKGK